MKLSKYCHIYILSPWFIDPILGWLLFLLFFITHFIYAPHFILFSFFIMCVSHICLLVCFHFPFLPLDVPGLTFVSLGNAIGRCGCECSGLVLTLRSFWILNWFFFNFSSQSEYLNAGVIENYGCSYGHFTAKKFPLDLRLVCTICTYLIYTLIFIFFCIFCTFWTLSLSFYITLFLFYNSFIYQMYFLSRETEGY